MALDYFPLVMGLAGVLLGAVLTGLGYLYRENVERRRMCNRALFALLQIRHAVHMLLSWDEHDLAKFFLDRLRARIPNTHLGPQEEKEAIEYFAAEFNRQFNDFSSGFLQPDARRYSTHFREVIHRLAAVEPVMAHRLSGFIRVPAILDTVSASLRRALEGTSKEDLPTALRVSKGALRAFGNIVDTDMQKEIRKLGLSVGFKTFGHVWRQTRRPKDPKKRLREVIDRYVDDYLERVQGAGEQVPGPSS